MIGNGQQVGMLAQSGLWLSIFMTLMMDDSLLFLTLSLIVLAPFEIQPYCY